MDQQFVDTYRQATLERDEKFLRARWKLVTEVTSKLSPAGALELIRVFLDLPSYDRSSIATLLDAVKDPGPQYARPEVTLELRLLAGLSLDRLLQEPSLRVTRTADLAALALVCCRNWRPTAPMVQSQELLSETALHQLMERSVAVRRLSGDTPQIHIQIPSFPSISLTTIENKKVFKVPTVTQDDYGSLKMKDINFSVTLNEIDTTQFSDWSKEASKQLQQYTTAIASMINEKIQESLAVFPRMRNVLFEENNILWWLFGETSNTWKKPFAQIELPVLCVIIANELVTLTKQTPGPAAVLAYIDRALRSGRNNVPELATIAELVATVTADNRPSWQNHMRPQLADLCPITQSLCAGADVSDKESGRYAMELSPAELTFQLYQEFILHRLHREVVV